MTYYLETYLSSPDGKPWHTCFPPYKTLEIARQVKEQWEARGEKVRIVDEKGEVWEGEKVER